MFKSLNVNRFHHRNFTFIFIRVSDLQAVDYNVISQILYSRHVVVDFIKNADDTLSRFCEWLQFPTSFAFFEVLQKQTKKTIKSLIFASKKTHTNILSGFALLDEMG